MRLYTVYQSPDARGETDLVFIKDGFCWPALILPVLWPLFRKLWLVAFAIVVLFVALSVLVEAGLLAPFAGSVIEAAIAVIVAFEGNNLRRWTLQRRGWREIGMVSGRNLAAAERAFFTDIEVTPTGALLPRQGWAT